jgi:hypothetical protein
MFGYAAFAQSTFAGLGGTAYALSISEAITSADSSSQASAFLQSITEPITVTQVPNDTGGNFFGSVTEAISVADSSTQQSTFLLSRAENLNPADTPTITGQFAVSRTEPITIADTSVQYFAALDAISEPITMDDFVVFNYFFSIVESLSVADLITLRAQFQAAVVENTNMADNTKVAGWIKIIDDQIANWALVSTTENAGWTVVSTTDDAGWTLIDNLQ